MTPDRYQKFRKVLQQRQPDLTVLTDQVHKPHNLGAIIRTCDAVGIHEIHLSQCQQGYRQMRHMAMGSMQWISVRHHASITSGATLLKEQGFRLYAAHPGDQACSYHNIDYTSPSAIILGAEKSGLSPEALQLADEHIVIPMKGMVASFNVSVAGAIILSEAQKQREDAGYYQQQKLDNTLCQQLIFRWGYPKLAQYCESKDIPYPDLDEEGQLIEPSIWHARIGQYGAQNSKQE